MDVEQLNYCLNELHSKYSTANARVAVETLLKIHRNIFFNKDNPEKYRHLKLGNLVFKNQIWNLPPAQQFMVLCGWKEADNVLKFYGDENLIFIIDTLLNHRVTAPCSSEWVEASKIENLHTSEQREEKLRAEAAKEREKELEEFKKDKLYRESLKQKVAEDRKEREIRRNRAVLVDPPRSTMCQPLPSRSAACQKCFQHTCYCVARRLNS